ncbi:MAG: MMPL family transporter, partial [Brachybacterium sp.]
MASPADAPVSTENTHRRKVPRTVRPLRILLPALLILGWVIAAAIGGPYFGRVDEVSSNDRTTYLPDSADATQVAQRAADFTGSESIPAIIVITSSDELDEEAAAAVGETTEALAEIDAVNGEISPAIPSEDGLAVQVFVPIDSDADLAQTITQVEEELAADLPEGLTSYVTGPAGFSADLAAGFTGLDGLLLGVALAAVFVIL